MPPRSTTERTGSTSHSHCRADANAEGTSICTARRRPVFCTEPEIHGPLAFVRARVTPCGKVPWAGTERLTRSTVARASRRRTVLPVKLCAEVVMKLRRSRSARGSMLSAHRAGWQPRRLRWSRCRSCTRFRRCTARSVWQQLGISEIWQPSSGSHVSAVQGLVSAQLSGVPPCTTARTSRPLQTSLSSTLRHRCRYGSPRSGCCCTCSPSRRGNASTVSRAALPARTQSLHPPPRRPPSSRRRCHSPRSPPRPTRPVPVVMASCIVN